MNRFKAASLLARMYKIAEDQKKKKNYDLPLYGDAALAGFLAPMGVVGGGSFADALAHEIRNRSVDRFNARVKQIARRIATRESAINWAEISRDDPVPLDFKQHGQRYRQSGLKKLEHKINKMNARVAKVDAKMIPRAKRVGGAIGGITMALPAMLLFKKHLDQKKRETGRYF